jgi:predicted GH43/DUF377 family glycosyl hydrolase
MKNPWVKYENNPVFGDSKTGTCFDLIVLPGGGSGFKYKMYFSWRPKCAIASALSSDGIHWTEPEILLAPDETTGWEDNINRCAALELDGALHMWYTGQAHDNSWIGYARASSGGKLERMSREPVLFPELPCENMSVMNPCVLWDEKRRVFRMWYSAGETFEPNVICYAESADGLDWRKFRGNPIFVRAAGNRYESNRIGGCQVVPHKGGFLLFYIGYEDIDTARVCAAWSPDGVTRWRKFAANPLVSPEPGQWDGDACYKPSVAYEPENNRWLLWYNGRRGNSEYIGLAIHEGDISIV